MADIVNIVGAAQAGVWRTRKGLTPGRSPSHAQGYSHSIGIPQSLSRRSRQLGTLKAEIADLEVRKRTIAGELIRRGVSEAEGALIRSLVVAERWFRRSIVRGLRNSAP